MFIKLVLFTLLALLFPFLNNSLSYAQRAESKPFFPTWKLLSVSEKSEFIAGYLHGWSDAKNVTEIAIGYIKDNPDKAVKSLEEIKKLYDLNIMKPDDLVSAIDAFYEKPGNKAAPLSVAVTAVKNSLSK